MTARTAAKWAVPVLAFLGLADSAYLSVLHWQRVIPPCGGYAGCEQVNTSPYAEIFGVPVAALGTLFYLSVLAVGLWRMRSSGDAWFQASLILYGLTLAGALFMAYLTLVEVFVLGAVCYWCLASAVISLILLALSIRDLWVVAYPGLGRGGARG